MPGLRTLADGFPTNSLTDPNTPNLFSENQLRTPYVEQWHVTVQHEIGPKTTVEAAYVGSKGTHLYTTSNLNQAEATADRRLTMRRGALSSTSTRRSDGCSRTDFRTTTPASSGWKST